MDSSRSPRAPPEEPMRTPSRSTLLEERVGARGQLLETNFDETPQHTRSASYSSMGLQVHLLFEDNEW